LFVEACDAPRFAEPREDFTRALGGRKGAIVFAQQDERLDRTAQRARRFLLISQDFVDFESLFVMLDRAPVIP